MLSKKAVALTFAFLISALLIFMLGSLTGNGKIPCHKSAVAIDVSSLESILLRTDEILDDPDEFWDNDGAYRLAKRWHDINDISFETQNYYETWIDSLEEINNLNAEQKRNHVSFNLMNEIILKKEIFDESALPHICSFFPQNDIDLSTTVYITMHTLPWAIMVNGEVLINVMHSHYDGRRSADDFMNTIVHEVFHIGYGINRSYRKETEIENLNIYRILDAFQNEGMATYAGYKAQKFFPAGGEKDYIILEDTNEVKKLLKMLNDFFLKIETKNFSESEMRSEAWSIGVMQRAYYVVGAFMAKTIDEKSGRKSLVETMEQGPVYFISAYNKIVQPEMQVFEFK